MSKKVCNQADESEKDLDNQKKRERKILDHFGKPSTNQQDPTRGNRNQRARSHQRANTRNFQGGERQEVSRGTRPLRFQHNRQKKTCAKSQCHDLSERQGPKEIPKSLERSRTKHITDKGSPRRAPSDVTTLAAPDTERVPSNF